MIKNYGLGLIGLIEDKGGAALYILYGRVWYDDAPEPRVWPVAEFDSEKLAKQYVEDVSLESYPNCGYRFRRDSLLAGASNFEIEKKLPPLPFNPVALTSPPKVEYAVVIPNNSRVDKPYRILCRKKEEAERELTLANEFGSEAYIEERLV